MRATISYGHEQVEHISVTVAPNYPGPVPTGSVTVKKSTTTLCVVKLSAAKGSCTLTGSALPTGAYGVYATYSRNADFVGSTAPKETLTVARATTTTTLTLSTAKVTLGHEQAARFSVTVGDSFAAGPKPAGTVTIKKSTTTLCVIKLSAGKGSCTMAGSKLQPRQLQRLRHLRPHLGLRGVYIDEEDPHSRQVTRSPKHARGRASARPLRRSSGAGPNATHLSAARPRLDRRDYAASPALLGSTDAVCDPPLG